MTLALIAAGIFALLAVLMLLAWPLVWAVPGTRLKTLTGPEARFLGGMAASFALAAVLLPFAAAALISGGDTVHLMLASVQAMQFGL